VLNATADGTFGATVTGVSAHLRRVVFLVLISTLYGTLHATMGSVLTHVSRLTAL
jgi:hypothetical protein